MKIFYAFIIVLVFFITSLANVVVAKDFESLSNIVVIDSSDGTLTLQDLAISMGLTQQHFETEYERPTSEELEDTYMESYPIIMWRNPFVTPYISPHANRYNQYLRPPEDDNPSPDEPQR